MAPVGLRELIERNQALPIMVYAFNRLWRQPPIPVAELVPELLAGCPGVGIRHRAQQGLGFRLVLLGDGIQHVQEPMVPATLLLRGGLLVSQGSPNA